MAYMGLRFADPKFLKDKKLSFDCSTCPLPTQKMRKCREDRWDMGEEDGNFWPLFLGPPVEGQGFDFCPGKSQHDSDAIQLFRLLFATKISGTTPFGVPYFESPDWFVSASLAFNVEYEERSRQENLRNMASMFGG